MKQGANSPMPACFVTVRKLNFSAFGKKAPNTRVSKVKYQTVKEQRGNHKKCRNTGGNSVPKLQSCTHHFLVPATNTSCPITR
jgi:hypothetical protein